MQEIKSTFLDFKKIKIINIKFKLLEPKNCTNFVAYICRRMAVVINCNSFEIAIR